MSSKAARQSLRERFPTLLGDVGVLVMAPAASTVFVIFTTSGFAAPGEACFSFGPSSSSSSFRFLEGLEGKDDAESAVLFLGAKNELIMLDFILDRFLLIASQNWKWDHLCWELNSQFLSE